MTSKTAAATADDADLAALTPEERAALASDDDVMETPEPSVAAQADEDELRREPEVLLNVAAPAGVDDYLKKIDAYEAEAERQFDEGEITAAEYRKALREAAEKRGEAEWAKRKADLSASMKSQAEDQAWWRAVNDFMATTGAAIKSDAMKQAFDEYVKRVTGDAANAHLSDKAQLSKAYRQFMSDMRGDGAGGDDDHAAASEASGFAQIDRMIENDPLRAEAALARMSPEEMERYLS